MTDVRADEATYRLFLLNKDGLIDVPPVELAAPTDIEALYRAARYPHPNAMELWRDDRLVAQLEPRAPNHVEPRWDWPQEDLPVRAANPGL